MPAHNVFTEIDARSYAAIVKKGYLSEVLLALLVDPLEAEDVAESIDTRRFSSILLQANGRVVSAPIRLEDFQSLPSKDAFEKLKITLYQRVMKSGRAESALSQITEWSQRIGVWCACAVAREALRYVPEGDQRPLRAIEMAELWAVGKATINEVKAASYDAYNTYASAPRRLAGFAAAAYASPVAWIFADAFLFPCYFSIMRKLRLRMYPAAENTASAAQA